MMDTSKLKGKVEWCLENYPITRNDDVALTLRLWVSFYYGRMERHAPNGGTEMPLGDWKLRIKDIMDLPREDQISRIRRKFQEAGQYHPTDPEVARKRKLLAKDARENRAPWYAQ